MAESPAHAQKSFETIQEALDSLAELEGALPILRAKVEEIEALCRMLKSRNDVSIKALKGICEQLPAIQKTYAQLTSHSVAGRALGALFQGIDTHKAPGVVENIAIATQLARLPEKIRDAVIAATSASGGGVRPAFGKRSRRPWPRRWPTTRATASTARRSGAMSRRPAQKGDSRTGFWPLAGRVHL